MRFPMVGKAAALVAVSVALMIAIDAIQGLVNERRNRQLEAEQNVANASSGPQVVAGPVLRRRCVEQWDHVVGAGKDSRVQAEQRETLLTAFPQDLNLRASAAIEPRYRGIFKSNGYLSKMQMTADWSSLDALKTPLPKQLGGRVSCDAATLAVGVGDSRGIQSASVRAAGQTLEVLPGSGFEPHNGGFHAVLLAQTSTQDLVLNVEVTLELAGTRHMSWIPVGDQTQVRLESDWPHPSFAGRFLPNERKIEASGFNASWKISALATTAQQAMRAGMTVCALGEVAAGSNAPCVDSFGVSFMDPVNHYVLSDRALKYAVLFIALTFVGVTLLEVMRRVRVHPVQYLLVGCALTTFFLLLLSLSEHLPFMAAYAAAAAACVALLGYYGFHILGGLRAGLGFGSAIAMLYGVLFALLQLEQCALVLGSMLLFAVLAAAMVMTRRVDWYALARELRTRSSHSTGTPP